SSIPTPTLGATAIDFGGNAGAVVANLTLKVVPDTLTALSQSQTIASGQTATLAVAPTKMPTPTYQWHRGLSGTLTNPITGATASHNTTPALTRTTSSWVRVSNSVG